MNKFSHFLALLRISICFLIVSSYSLEFLNAKDEITQYDGQPALSPDGTMVAFISFRSGNDDLWIMNSDGSSPINVTTNFKDSRQFQPIWSPDSRHILFLSLSASLDDKKSDLWLVSLDTKKLQQLTSDLTAGNPQWSPDGKSIVFELFEDSNINSIWLMNSDGTNSRKLIEGNPIMFPRWSPDGKSIVYVVTNGRQTQLTLTEIETGKTRILSTNDILSFAWAPQSNLIIYSTVHDIVYSDIWLIQTDTASEFKLTDKPIPLASELKWSPDMEKILFKSFCGASFGINMMILKEKLVVNITSCQQEQDSFVSWFPDSEHILFQSNRSGKMSIWIMSANGKDAVDLINPSQ